MNYAITGNSGYHFSLSHNPQTDFIEMEVKGFMRGADFRENTLQMFRLLQSLQLNKVLVKTQDLKMIDKEDRTWLEKSFLPYAISNGFKAVSFIMPEDYYARLSIETVMYTIPENKLQGTCFEREEEARGWLKNNACLPN